MTPSSAISCPSSTFTSSSPCRTELHALFLAAPKVAYRLLFAAVAETLTQVALRRLGAKIAFTAVLHTWTQPLLL